MAAKNEENISRKTFSPEIEECICAVQNHVNLVYTTQNQDFMPYCEKLLAFAVAEQSDYLFCTFVLLSDDVLCRR